MRADIANWRYALILSLVLGGCAVMTIDVDVYKGALTNEEDVQVQQTAALAIGAKPVLEALRDIIDSTWFPDEQTQDNFKTQLNDLLDLYRDMSTEGPYERALVKVQERARLLESALEELRSKPAWTRTRGEWSAILEKAKQGLKGCPFVDPERVDSVAATLERFVFPDRLGKRNPVTVLREFDDLFLPYRGGDFDPSPDAKELASKLFSDEPTSQEDWTGRTARILQSKAVPERGFDAEKLESILESERNRRISRKATGFADPDRSIYSADFDYAFSRLQQSDEQVTRVRLGCIGSELAVEIDQVFLAVATAAKGYFRVRESTLDLWSALLTVHVEGQSYLESLRTMASNDDRTLTVEGEIENVERVLKTVRDRIVELVSPVPLIGSLNLAVALRAKAAGKDEMERLWDKQFSGAHKVYELLMLSSPELFDVLSQAYRHPDGHVSDSSILDDSSPLLGEYLRKTLRGLLSSHPTEMARGLDQVRAIFPALIESSRELDATPLLSARLPSIYRDSGARRCGIVLPPSEKLSTDAGEIATAFRRIATDVAYLRRPRSSLDGTRTSDGLETLTRRFVERSQAGLSTAEDRKRLFELLTRFAEQVIFLADHSHLVQAGDTPAAWNLLRGLTQLVPFPLHKHDESAFAAVLQAVGNAILTQVNELERARSWSERNDSSELRDREIAAVNHALRPSAKYAIDSILDAVALRRNELAGERAKLAAEEEAQLAAIDTEAAHLEYLRGKGEEWGGALVAEVLERDREASADDVWVALRVKLEKEAAAPGSETEGAADDDDGAAASRDHARWAQTFVAHHAPRESLPPEVTGARSAKDVLDYLIRVNYHELLEEIRLRGENTDRAARLRAYLKEAQRIRSGFVFIRPASAYLRSSYTVSTVQKNTDQGWRNLLAEHSAHNVPIYGWFPDRNRRIALLNEFDKQSWQSVNRIRVAGGGDTNYVVAKDDVGNWYVKQYSTDVSKIVASAAGLAEFAAGAALGSSAAGAAVASAGALGEAAEESGAGATAGVEQPAPSGHLERFLIKVSKDDTKDADEVWASVESAASGLEDQIREAWEASSSLLSEQRQILERDVLPVALARVSKIDFSAEGGAESVAPAERLARALAAFLDAYESAAPLVKLRDSALESDLRARETALAEARKNEDIAKRLLVEAQRRGEDRERVLLEARDAITQTAAGRERAASEVDEARRKVEPLIRAESAALDGLRRHTVDFALSIAGARARAIEQLEARLELLQEIRAE